MSKDEKIIEVFKDFNVPESVIKSWNKMIDTAADEVHGWVQDAVGDMANSYHDFLDNKWSKKIKEAKKYGVTDLKGWLADEYYSDPDTLEDLIGDRVYDKATEILGYHEEPQHTLMCDCILEKMRERSHPAMEKAIDSIMERHKHYMQENSEKWRKISAKRTS